MLSVWFHGSWSFISWKKTKKLWYIDIYNTILYSPYSTIVCYMDMYVVYDWSASILVSHLITYVTLMFSSCSHLCSYSLMINDYITTILYAHFTLLVTFNSYPLSLNRESVRVKKEHLFGVSHQLTYFNSTTILLTWLKPFNKGCDFRLTSSSTVAHYTDWTYYIFPLWAWMLHYMLKIYLTNLLCRETLEAYY